MIAIQKQLLIALVVDLAYHFLNGVQLTPVSLFLWFIPFFIFVGSIFLTLRIFVYPTVFSPFRHLPALERTSIFWGNFADFGVHKYHQGLEMADAYPDADFTRFWGPLGADYLIAQSFEANQAIMQAEVYSFMKPTTVSRGFKAVIGNGLFFSEGQEHKFQRRLLTPAFTSSHVRTFLPVFVNGLIKLTTILDEKLKDGPQEIKMLPYISRLALDSIGEAAFGVNLGALTDENNELVRAYHRLSAPTDEAFDFMLLSIVPGWSYVPTPVNRRMKASKKIFKDAVSSVLKRRIDAVYEKQVFGKDRDILSILLKDETHRWTVDEIENQMMTLLLAGHETTASGLSWGLHLLAINQDMQDRLRTEIRTELPNGLASWDSAEAILNLKYLNNVARECLRLASPIPVTLREARIDVEVLGLKIHKGTQIFIPIEALNKSPRVWGADAKEFNPDRWDNTQITSPYGFSTFIHGARSCIGRRIAELEFRTFMAAFVSKYKFEIITPEQAIPEDFVLTLKPGNGMLLKVSIVPGYD
ncbi:cytochrome P450 [Lipomyces oligophaga]|uniref:cytochrome P450 n=1 Tax=Lipomyces oligophaga TaxID=45792 RepID=UPI0034CEF539